MGELRSITSKELGQHNTPESLWVGYRGQVFDLTEFVQKHPGGSDVLLFAGGRDVTIVFEIYHNLVLSASLKPYLIGTLEDNDLPVFPPSSQFFKTVKSRVFNQLKSQKFDSKYPSTIWLRYAFIYSGVVLSYLALWKSSFVAEQPVLQLGCSILLGFFCALVGLHPLHDASHCAATRSPWVWRILGGSHDFINGASFVVWIYQHLLGHHPYTNIEGADPDISTGNPDVRRIKATQPWFPLYFAQHIYVPLIYGLLGVKTRIQDISLMFIYGSNDQIPMNPMGLWHTCVFWLGKAFFLTYRILIPLFVFQASYLKVFGLFAISDAMTSYWLALTFQANHVVEETIWPKPDPKTNEMNVDWAEMQIATTQDYAHQSKFWTLSTGALNYQAVHHLFPQIHQAYYPMIAPVIQATCKEFGIPYLVKPDFLTALSSHVGHLRYLGFNEDQQKKTE
jgi:fatty acid desaturase